MPAEQNVEQPRPGPAPAGPVLPDYVVRHTNVGGVFSQGDVIPPGTYSEEQLARLVELGAVEPATPSGVPPAAVAALPESAATYQAAQEAAARAAADGMGNEVDPLADLTEQQQVGLRAAGYTTAAEMREASDDDLLAIPGVGATTVRRLREITGAPPAEAR